MTVTVRHVGIVVQDLELCIKFWKDIFEFEIVVDQIEPSPYIDELIGIKYPNLRTVKLKDKNGMIIELLKFENYPDSANWNNKIYSTGLTHIALTVSNLEDIKKILIKNNFLLKSKTMISDKNLVKVLFAQGPENILLELVETT
jgi:catechol-2,3-dioxygenase